MSTTDNKGRASLPVAGKADARTDVRVSGNSGLQLQTPSDLQLLPVAGSRRLDTVQTVNLSGHPMSTEHGGDDRDEPCRHSE
jgi:hypothetical protein